MNIENLTGLEKPIMKLFETVGEYIGVVGNHIFEFDAAKIRRIGQAEADVEKQKIISRAEGQEMAVEILGRAKKRFALEQYNKQINLENILVKTKDDLNGKTVSEDPVEKDWTMRFLDVAQNISREELQAILAKILSGEIQKPGRFSFKTLEIIKYLSKTDLEKLQKFIALSSRDGFFRFGGVSQAEMMRKYDLDFTDFVRLSDLGLFNQSLHLSVSFDIKCNMPAMTNIGKEIFAISLEKGAKKLDISCSLFSTAGQEIYSLLLDDAKNEKLKVYIEDFIKYIESQGCKIQKIKFKG